MQIKKIASFDVKNGASTVRYADLDDGISFFPTDGIINIKSNKVRIAGFGVDSNSLYRIDNSGAMYPLGDSNSVFLSNEGLLSSASIGGSSGNNNWILAISNDFGVTDGGTLYARNANIDGAVNASKGKIADYTIDGAMLVGNNVGLSGTSGQGWAFWAGSNDASSAPFRVGHEGYLVASDANIGGTITAEKGNIGGWVIKSNGIYQKNAFGNVSVTTGVGNIDDIGTSDIDFLRVQKSDGTYPFYVHKDGFLYASNAEIEGKITGSTIIGSTINGGTIIGAKISGTVTNGGTITGGNIWGDFVQAQFLQTASNSATNGHGCDIWTGAIRLSELKSQNDEAGNINVYAKMHIHAHTKISGGLEVDGQQNGNGLASAAIRTKTSGSYLEVVTSNSNGQAYGCDAWRSDARLKNTIKNTSIVATPVIERMKFKQFNWNDSGAHVNIGLIAQDLEKINPDLVMKIDQHNGSYMYQVSTTMMSTITAKAVQETISKVNTLESDMNLAISQTKSELEMKLMTENQKLKDKLAFLEEKIKYMNGEKSSYSEG